MTNAISYFYVFSFSIGNIETNEPRIQTTQLVTIVVPVQELLE